MCVSIPEGFCLRSLKVCNMNSLLCRLARMQWTIKTNESMNNKSSYVVVVVVDSLSLCLVVHYILINVMSLSLCVRACVRVYVCTRICSLCPSSASRQHHNMRALVLLFRPVIQGFHAEVYRIGQWYWLGNI